MGGTDFSVLFRGGGGCVGGGGGGGAPRPGGGVAVQKDVVTRTHDVVGLEMQLAQKHEKLQHLFRQA